MIRQDAETQADRRLWGLPHRNAVKSRHSNRHPDHYRKEEAVKDRKEILLRAAYDLLKRSTQDFYVSEATGISTRYDESDCDGYCLMDDIAAELGLDEGTDPIPLGDDDDEPKSARKDG